MDAQENNTAADNMQFNDNPGKENYFKGKSTEYLQKQLDIYLTMDNLGGKLADDIIDELMRRARAEGSGIVAKA